MKKEKVLLMIYGNPKEKCLISLKIGEIGIDITKKDVQDLLGTILGAAEDLGIKVDYEKDEWDDLGDKLIKKT